MSPVVWGKYLWTSIHFIALGYPMEPTDQEKENYRDFFVHLWKVIPCARCAQNYKLHLEELPIDGFLDNRDVLFEWTVNLHNIVNRDLGKPLMSLDDAKKLYHGKLNRHPHPTFTWPVYLLLMIIIILLIWYLTQKHFTKF
jgi:hypothetical protein